MSPAPAPPRELDGMTRVLMVAEERGHRHALRRQLVQQGFAVEVAADAQDARRRCESTRYDVVLLDLTATGPDGFALCRDLGDGDDGPMVMMLAPPDGGEERLAGFAAGAAACVSKPVMGREIAARLRALTRRRTAASDLQTAPQ